MKNMTYFRALKRCRSKLKRCRSKLSVIEHKRGTIQGIAVNSDWFALRWQRYDRLARKLEQKLVAMLSED